MSDATVGAFVIIGAIGLGLLVVSLKHVSIGMTLTALILGFSGIAVFVASKSVIHEILGGVLVVGGALCLGIAGLSRQMDRLWAKPQIKYDSAAGPSLGSGERQGWEKPSP